MHNPRICQDATGILGRAIPYGITEKEGLTVPTDGDAGYAKGCRFYKLDGAAGSQIYINEGSETSADFNPLLLPGVALSGLTANSTELNTLHNQTLTTGAGAGITSGAGTISLNRVQPSGNMFITTLLLDLTGLGSSTTDLDIIGNGTGNAPIALLTAAQQGATILAVSMTCLEAPAGGVTDIDMYSATEGTGKFDDAVTGLTETALITSGGAWSNGATKAATVVPLSTEYLYLTGGAAGTAATYTAGKFLIVLYGYN